MFNTKFYRTSRSSRINVSISINTTVVLTLKSRILKNRILNSRILWCSTTKLVTISLLRQTSLDES